MYAKYMLKYRGDKIYCSIVCTKSLTEQVRKRCLLCSVSFQHVFFSGSRSNQCNFMKRKKNPKFQGSRRSLVHLSYTQYQQFSRGCIWHYQGEYTLLAERIGDTRSGSHLQQSISTLLWFVQETDSDCLHGSKPDLFLQFKTILPVFAVVLESTAMCINPD